MIEKYLEEILGWLESGVEFVKTTAPVFVQEVLTYYTILYIVTFVISGVFIFVFFKVLSISFKKYSEIAKEKGSRYFNDEEMPWFFASVFSFIIIFAAVIVAIVTIGPMLKVLFAPTLFLVEKVAQML